MFTLIVDVDRIKIKHMKKYFVTFSGDRVHEKKKKMKMLSLPSPDWFKFCW